MPRGLTKIRNSRTSLLQPIDNYCGERAPFCLDAYGHSMNIDFTIEQLAKRIPLNLDLAGVFFHEAHERFEEGRLSLIRLEEELPLQDERVSRATTIMSDDERENAWVEAIQGVGGLEPSFSKVIREFTIGQILVVASAEAYVNAVAHYSLGGASAAQFDKLSPIGKWLFLPGVLGIKWKPDPALKPMQDFADLVGRRNRLIHPREIRIRGILDIRDFLMRIGADPDKASRDLKCVQSMIREFSLSWKGSYGPNWLEIDRAQKRPPCFFGGNIDGSVRFGRPGEDD